MRLTVFHVVDFFSSLFLFQFCSCSICFWCRQFSFPLGRSAFAFCGALYCLSLSLLLHCFACVFIYGWVGNRLLYVLTTSIKSTHLMFRMNSNGSFRAHQMFSLHGSCCSCQTQFTDARRKKTHTQSQMRTKLIK